MRKFLKLFYKAGERTVTDDGIEHAGYLSFLAILSIFPSLIFMFTLAGSIGRQDYGAEFISQLSKILPVDVMNALTPSINEILSGPPQGILTIAIIGILWTASSAVEGVRNILNKVYRVKNPPHYLFRRGISILQFVILIFVVITAMFFLTVVPGIVENLEIKFRVNIHINESLSNLRYLISSSILFFGIATTYYILPNIKQTIVNVLPGALICVGLWLAVIYGFTSFVKYYSNASNVYGSLAGIILTLLFFYVLNIIYIYGAEFNFLLEKALGHKIEEKE